MTVITADTRFYRATPKVQEKGVRHTVKGPNQTCSLTRLGVRGALDVSKEEEENGRQLAPPPHGATSHGTPPLQVWKQRYRNPNVGIEGGGGVRSEI